MNTFFVLWQKELFEQIRSRKLLIMAALFGFFAVTSPLLAKIMPELLKQVSTPGITISLASPTYLDALDQFMKNISQLGSFILIFVIAGAIADEKSRHTLELLLVKPISRTAYVLAKHAAYATTLSLTFIVCAAIFAGYTLSLFGDFNITRFCLVGTATILYLLYICSIVLFGSILARSALGAAGIGFIALIGDSIFSTVLPNYASYDPSFLISDYRTLMTTGWQTVDTHAALMAVIIIAILIITGISLFKRQEIER